jgi:hypothetical protein
MHQNAAGPVLFATASVAGYLAWTLLGYGYVRP